MFCSHCMCLDSDLVVQKINKQTNRQTDEEAMLPSFVLLYMRLPTVLFCSVYMHCSPVCFLTIEFIY